MEGIRSRWRMWRFWKWLGDNDYIVLTPDGIRCHALFNPFTGFYFADDVYRIVPDQKEETL